jgi:phenylalanyl-tRNA synthetase alpha subunit
MLLLFIFQYKHAIQCRDFNLNIESLELKIQSLETAAATVDRTSNKLDDFKASMMGILMESFGNISSQNTTRNERIMSIISNNESYSKNLDEIKDAMVKNQKETKDKLVGIQDSMVHKESITPLFQDQKTISKRLDGMNFLEKEFETYKVKVQQEKEEFSKKLKKYDSKVSTEKRVLTNSFFGFKR